MASELHRESTIAKESRKLNEERRFMSGQSSHGRASPIVDPAAGLFRGPDGGKGKPKAERAAAKAAAKAVKDAAGGAGAGAPKY